MSHLYTENIVPDLLCMTFKKVFNTVTTLILSTEVKEIKSSNASKKSCSIDSRNKHKQSPTCEAVHETKESSFQKSPTDPPWLSQ